MLPDPLHPAVVHFPVVLAMLVPIFAIAALIVKARHPAAARAWLVVVVLQLLLVASARVAIQSGGHEEEAVEKVVAEKYIHEHEESAEKLMSVGLVGLLLCLVGLARGKVGKAAQLLAVVAFLLASASAYQTAKLGGELVYKHGAGAAYASPLGISAEPGMEEFEGSDQEGHEENHE